MHANEIERLAQIIASKWRTHKDYADLLQEARLYVWRNSDLDKAKIVWTGKNRLIDVMRVSDGRKGTPGYMMRKLVLAGNEAVHSMVTTIDDEFDPIYDMGLTGRYKIIATMLILGCLKQDIATQLGVSPGRVTQLITEMREDLDWTDHFEDDRVSA